MKKSYVITSILTVFVNSVQGENRTTALDCEGWFSFVSATSTNVTFKMAPHGSRIRIFENGVRGHVPEYNEVFTLPLDKELTFTDMRHAWADYTPILTKNQQKGFKIVDVNFWGGKETITSVKYAALSNNIPVKISADDVEREIEPPPPPPKPPKVDEDALIAGYFAYMEAQAAEERAARQRAADEAAAKETANEPPPVPKGETPPPVENVAQVSRPASGQKNLCYLLAVIPCLLAALYFVWRKKRK